ncbi:MAG: glycosyltransferase family 2 protein [Candidatus Diapherotrites archaeon]
MHPMKLVVMIPAYNEAETIGQVIDEIPSKIKGIAQIQVLVIDDGCTDRTAEIAKSKGAIVLSHPTNKGLARTFQDGLNHAVIEMGANIIVNTDADMQYNQKQIPLLVQPILDGKADMVLGSRFKGWIEDMPIQKKWGNRLATKAVSLVSGLSISDGQTGFRAFSREAALRLNVLSAFTYTQETILQAAHYKLRILEIPVDFRKRDGDSRLFSSVWRYARRSILTLVIGYLNYKPLRIFVSIGGTIFLLGFLFGLFVLRHFLLTGLVSPHLPSAILSIGLILVGALIIILGLIAEMIKQNRLLQEEILYLQKNARAAIVEKKRGKHE